AGKPLPPAYTEENLELVGKGAGNLVRAIQIARSFGIPVVVAVNRFREDTAAEIDLVCRIAIEAGAGGLAEAVVKACRKPNDFHFLYPLDLSIKEKIEIIVREVYGGAGVKYL